MVHSKTRIVVVGGSYAGSEALTVLAKSSSRLNLEITLIEPRDHFHHNVAFVRAVTQQDFAAKCFVPYTNAPFFKSGAVRHERARVSETQVDRVVLEDGREIAFDYLILATGSRFGVPGRPAGDQVDEVLRQFETARQHITQARRILVVGGGAVGIELAGELADLVGDDGSKKEVTIVAPSLLAGQKALSDKLRQKIRGKLEGRGIRLVENAKVEVTAEERAAGYVTGADRSSWQLLSSSDGTANDSIETDLTFICTGHTGLNTALARSLGDDVVNTATEEIRIRPTLQLIAHDHIFAAGDCNDEGHKLAWAARVQAGIAANNIIKLIEDRNRQQGEKKGKSMPVKLGVFKPINAMLVTIGAQEGAGQVPGIGVIGRTLPKLLKGKDFMLKQTYKQFNAPAPSF